MDKKNETQSKPNTTTIDLSSVLSRRKKRRISGW
jgi:hypothetical protein